MGAAAAGLLAKGGGEAAAGGGVEAIMGKDAMSFFSKDPASASKIANFASEKNLDPTKILNMCQKLFGQNPGEANGPEHHKDPVESFINLFKNIMQLAEHAQGLADKAKLPKPTSLPSMKKLEPTAPHNDDENKDKEDTSVSNRPRPRFGRY